MARIIMSGTDDYGQDAGCEICGDMDTTDIEGFYAPKNDPTAKTQDVVEMCSNCRQDFELDLPAPGPDEEEEDLSEDVLSEKMFDRMYVWALNAMRSRQLAEAPGNISTLVYDLIVNYKLMIGYQPKKLDSFEVEQLASMVKEEIYRREVDNG